MAEYINRNELVENLDRFAPEHLTPLIRTLIEKQPTADVVEVKHSRWEKISGFDVCNICGTSPAYCEPKPNNPKGYPPYCHHCGAKMDGAKMSEFPTGSERSDV